jgi:hypothetical protein
MRMKLAIMQPYLFPYIGYFQLVAAVDKFVFYDDVNFIKNGWINRNRLLLAGEVRYLTVPLRAASPFQKINQIATQGSGPWQKKMAESLRHSYRKAPFFEKISPIFSEVIFAQYDNIADMAKHSVLSIAQYLQLDTDFVLSSAVYGNTHLHSAERVIDICIREQASCYYNLPGGRQLYDAAAFASHGIDLHFIETKIEPYDQAKAAFQPGLSMLDVLMFNDVATVKAMLSDLAAKR